MTSNSDKKRIAVIVPLYNEAKNINPFLVEFSRILPALSHYEYEIVFVNDGSIDDSASVIAAAQVNDPHIRYVEFSRNFGKEAATSAGLYEVDCDAALIIDADLQHPINLIPEFFAHWEEGSEVVIGVRNHSKSESVIRKVGSMMFYKILDHISETDITARATDFRLLDRKVIDAFRAFTEHNRMTRGLIDWLGFKRTYINFDANEREHGVAAYRLGKLIHLAFSGFVANSFFPLRLIGYFGVIITLLAGMLGLLEIADKYFVQWGFNFSGPAELATLTIFLVGIMLVSIGLLSFYIEHIYRNTQNRPLYVIRERK